MKTKKCHDCGNLMKKVEVSVEGAENKVSSLQCGKCGNLEFDKKTGMNVVKELRQKEQALKIKQKIVKLSHNRMGMYFNKHIVESLKLKPGEEISISVPDKKRIVIDL